MSEADRFYAWREEKIRENPDWKHEFRDWFLGMYLQTYPARTFPLMSELFDYFEGKDQENEQRKLSESVDDSDQAESS
jgi:hypothetical protein